MAKSDDSQPAQSQPKPKRPEEDTKIEDINAKPLQLQRRRVWRACESCRRKKIKCDGCEPTCSQCTMSGSQCTWLQTKDRAALSRHYVQELEARLLHMESVFSQIAPLIEQHVGNNPNGPRSDAPSSSAIPPEVLAPAAAILRSIAPKVEAADSPPNNPSPSSAPPPSNRAASPPSDDVSELFGQLALDEYGHMRWIGGSSTMSLIQSFKALTTAPQYRISPMEEDPQAPGPSVNKLYFPNSVFFGKVNALPGAEEVEFPDRDLADKLVDAYFTRFHFLMPVIDKPSFLRQYTHIMDNAHDIEVVRAEIPFLSLLFALFACSATLVQDPRLNVAGQQDDGGMGMVYYERALILQYISHPNIQVAHVQCFILMSSFLCSVNCLPQAWILIGQAVRTGQDLGLHRSPRRLLISPIDKETRRKIWWGVYVLDRMLALALGRPLGINDSDCDVELPVGVDDEHLPEYFSGAAMPQGRASLMTGVTALIKLYEIGGRVLRQVYAIENCKDHLEPERKAELQRTVESLDTELTKWCDELPVVFKSASDTEQQVSMGAILCSHYYSILTTLHRNLLPVKRDQPVTAKSTVKAVSSARSCIRLAPSMKHIVPPSHHLAFFIQHLFSSAVIVLLYAMHATDPRGATAAMDEARSTLSALESWEGQWPGARKCKELLIDLISTADQAIAAGNRDKNTTPTQTVAPSTMNPSPGHERRRSVTIAPIGSNQPGRAQKARQRRTQSRDAGPSSRRLNAVSPYRVDGGQRARSVSRKRGHDDGDNDRSAAAASGNFFQSFATPTAPRSGSSTHSSPASVNLPSPAMPSTAEQPEPPANQVQTTNPSNNAYNAFAPSLSPTQPQRYEFEYGVPPSALSQGNVQAWNASGGDAHMYSQGSSEHGQYHNFNAYGAMDGYGSYDGTHDLSGVGLSSSSPQSSTFAAIGLPFRALDFIRNYNSSGYPLSDQDPLWQSYDAGAFGYDPDLPFNLGDGNAEMHDPVR